MANEEKVKLPPKVAAMLVEFFNIAQQLPESPAATKRKEDLLNGNIAVCPITDREYDGAMVELLNDGYGPIRNFMHPDERAQFKGMCPVACVVCREVLAYVAPCKEPDGFQIEAGKIYHIVECPGCNLDKFAAGEAATTLVEKEIYRKYK